MKLRGVLKFLCAVLLTASVFSGCEKKDDEIKIGMSFGVGPAERWDHEKVFMEERAKEMGVNIEVRINRTDKPLTQLEDCKEMIDNGIDVLMLTPRDVRKSADILQYAKENNVPVINYARVLLNDRPDLYVGYDSTRIGQQQGQFLVELVDKGDYIILRGDEGDYNSQLVYDGAMRYIEENKDIRVILDTNVPGWSVDEAKRMVKEAIVANGNKIDAILAPNDKLSGASAEALKELGITTSVPIVGMDAELAAAKRIVEGTQTATIYMDLKVLAYTAVDEAIKMAKGEEPNVNAAFDNLGEKPIDSNLITGQLVTKENLDKILINENNFTYEQVYE